MAVRYEGTPEEYLRVLQESAKVWSSLPAEGCRAWATIEELITETFSRGISS